MHSTKPTIQKRTSAAGEPRYALIGALLLLLGTGTLQAQDPIVAFVGVTRTDSPDGFSFVAGENLPGGMDIYFTDEEYRDVCNAFHFDTLCEEVDDGEPYLVYTTPMDGLTAGEVVFVSETGSNTFTVSGAGGTIVLGGSASFTLSASDVLFAFATSDPGDPQDNVTEVYAALNLAAAFDGSIPIGDDPRVDHPNAVVTILNASNGEYTPALRSAAVTKADLENTANWTTTGTNLPLSTVNFTGGIDLSSGCTPELNGLTVIDCPDTPNGFFVLAADGALNGADFWIIDLLGDQSCGNLMNGFSFTDQITIAFSFPDQPYVVFSVGDCQTEQVCYTFTPSELFGLPNFTLATTTYFDNEGIQTGLGGATPVGGTYSGPGVTDDGNGMTFTFDPAAAGVGTHTVTYTTAGDGVCGEFTATQAITVTACVAPVITGVELIDCPDDPSGNYTFMVNGQLNNADSWQWTVSVVDGEECADLPSVFSGATFSTDFTIDGLTRTYYVRAVGGCVTEPVCFAYVPAELAGTAMLDLPNTGFCQALGSQTGLGGGSPSGGVYSGPGITDDGNGTTFTLDPFAAGAGTHTLTYTVNTGSACGESSATTEFSVFPPTPVSFTSSLTEVAIDAGVQTGVTGGSPAGGVYSGAGVTDDGNGMTFTFDPAAVGAGEVLVLYTLTDGNGCVTDQSDVITVTASALDGDLCEDAIDINVLFDGPLNQAVVSSTQDNTGYNPDNDPGAGYECWFGDDPVLNNTIWYAFTGDGGKYSIRSIACGDNAMTNTDTQFALYSGDCATPAAVACNDDEDFNNQVYNSYLEIVTEPGVNYLLMVDGYVAAADYAAIGSFCLEVTLLETVGVTDLAQTELKVYPNPTTGLLQLPNLDLDRVEVYDATGRQVTALQPNGPSLDLSAQPAGLYLLKMYGGEEVYSAKVVKE